MSQVSLPTGVGAEMVISHLPPDPGRRVAWLVAAALLTPLGCWLAQLAAGTEPSFQAGQVAIFGLAVGPVASLFASSLLERWSYRWVLKRPGDIVPRPHGAASTFDERHVIVHQEQRRYSFVDQGPTARASAPPSFRYPCFRATPRAHRWRHPLMLVQYVLVVAGGRAVIWGGSYELWLLDLVVVLWTVTTVLWLVIVASSWSVIEVHPGNAWLDDVSRGPFRGFERTRILTASGARDGIVVDVEREGPVELAFAGGTLPLDVQRDLVLRALTAREGSTKTAPQLCAQEENALEIRS